MTAYATKSTILHFLQLATAKSWGLGKTNSLLAVPLTQKLDGPVPSGPHGSCAYGHYCKRRILQNKDRWHATETSKTNVSALGQWAETYTLAALGAGCCETNRQTDTRPLHYACR